MSGRTFAHCVEAGVFAAAFVLALAAVIIWDQNRTKNKPAGPGTRTRERLKKPKPEAQAYCPSCKRIQKSNGRRLYTDLFRQGDHLVWAMHSVPTWGDTQVPCRSAGVAYCQSPAIVEPFAICACTSDVA